MVDMVRLPVDIERGASGGPEYRTTVIELDSGHERRNQGWELPRGRWLVGYGIADREEYERIIRFFRARRGRLNAFLFRDWSDYQAEDQPVEAVPGEASMFQLARRYSDGTFAVNREIKYPVSDELTIEVSGSEATTGWTLSAGGILTFSTDPLPTAGDITWSGEWDVPVRFDTDHLEVTLENFIAGSVPNIPIVEVLE